MLPGSSRSFQPCAMPCPPSSPPPNPPQEELSSYPDLEYCKTDLIASKGCVFVKYAKASSALRALEEVAAKGEQQQWPGQQ